jgi:SAM-dependent methyltransferase
MSESWQVAGDAARVYERELVPALFAEWPPRVLDATRPMSGDRVLDVACGTGIVTRRVLTRHCAAVGLDLNRSMLLVAAELAADAAFVQGSASALPFADGCFDAAVMQFALMYVPDRALAVKEMQRVVRSGGRVVAVVWASIELNPGYRVLAELFDEVAGDAAATFRSPYSLGDPAELQRLFSGAGLHEIEVDTVEGEARFDSVGALLRGEIDGSPLAARMSSTDPDLVDRAHAALGTLVQPDGHVIFANPGVIVCGRKMSR